MAHYGDWPRLGWFGYVGNWRTCRIGHDYLVWAFAAVRIPSRYAMNRSHMKQREYIEGPEAHWQTLNGLHTAITVPYKASGLPPTSQQRSRLRNLPLGGNRKSPTGTRTALAFPASLVVFRGGASLFLCQSVRHR